MRDMQYLEPAIFCDVLIEQGVDAKEIKQLARESGLLYVPRNRNRMDDMWHNIHEFLHRAVAHPPDTYASRLQTFYVMLTDNYPEEVQKYRHEIYERIHQRPCLESVLKAQD